MGLAEWEMESMDGCLQQGTATAPTAAAVEGNKVPAEHLAAEHLAPVVSHLLSEEHSWVPHKQGSYISSNTDSWGIFQLILTTL